MKKNYVFLFSMLLAGLSSTAYAQGELIQQSLPNPDNEPAPVFPVPSERQLLWQETEFYAFFHYGMNTYTGKEWGYGDEALTTFRPPKHPNCEQWVQAAKDAGMKGGIAVVKHHDGFCLWPTKTTDHNANNCGLSFEVNVPKAYAEASEKLGMKYGFYISPWDRNSAHYGKDTYVKEVFLKQATELAQYGNNQFEMWFDGANGGDGYYGGEGGTRSIDASTYYDVPNLADSIHKLQPNCVMWGVGDEARWIGNEAGWAGTTNWSTEYKPSRGAGEYGSEDGWRWFPGESDAKGTNMGWFWHAGEQPRSLNELYKFYLETVGRNATLILNFPPDQNGELPDATVKRMKELGDLLKTRLGNDLASKAKITVSETRAAGANRSYIADNLNDDNKDTYWATNDGTIQATITLTWNEPVNVHYVALMEYIKKGQRVKSFTIETTVDGSNWTARATDQCTTIGYKRIIPLNGSTTDYGAGYTVKAIRITINDSKACPLLHTISVY